MKTALQKKLISLAPEISIKTIWSPDVDNDWDELKKPGNCFEHERRSDWECWQSEIRATVINYGEIKTASAYLGGTWEKRSANPAESNPEISGYENQMTAEALEGLKGQVSSRLQTRINYLLNLLKEEAQIRYEKQRAELAAKNFNFK